MDEIRKVNFDTARVEFTFPLSVQYDPDWAIYPALIIKNGIKEYHIELDTNDDVMIYFYDGSIYTYFAKLEKSTNTIQVYLPVNMNGQRITNLADPVDPQDAATKAYVDLITAGGVVKITENDTTANYLYYSVENKGAINLEVLNPGADETLGISVKVDNATIEIDPTNDWIQVKDGGITPSKIDQTQTFTFSGILVTGNTTFGDGSSLVEVKLSKSGTADATNNFIQSGELKFEYSYWDGSVEQVETFTVRAVPTTTFGTAHVEILNNAGEFLVRFRNDKIVQFNNSTIEGVNTIRTNNITSGTTAVTFLVPLDINSKYVYNSRYYSLLGGSDPATGVTRKLWSDIAGHLIWTHPTSGNLNVFFSVALEDLDMNGNYIINLPDPVNPTDAVNKRYVDQFLTTKGFFVVPDNGSITDALTWASNNNGGIIVIKPGTYSVPTSTVVPSGTIIIGINKPVITNADENNIYIFDLSNNSNIIIDGLAFDTTGATTGITPIYGATVNNVVVKNCEIRSNYRGIDLAGSNIYIINTYSRSHYNQINLYVRGSNIWVVNSQIVNGYYGIGHPSAGITNGFILGNYFYCEDYANGLVLQDGIFIGGTSTNVVIQGNVFETRDIGVRIAGDKLSIKGNTFSRVPISGIGLNGIILVDTTNSIVEGNVVLGYSNNSILEINSTATSDYNMIVNNRCSHQISTVGPNTLVANNLVG